VDRFLDDLSSSYWWMSVVTVGILINLVSNYLQKRLDTRLLGILSLWRGRSKVQKTRRQKELEELRNNPEKRILLAFDEMRFRIRSIWFLILATLCWGFAFTFEAPPHDSLTSAGWLS
jgi:hypothetical protein